MSRTIFIEQQLYVWYLLDVLSLFPCSILTTIFIFITKQSKAQRKCYGQEMMYFELHLIFIWKFKKIY